MKKKILSVLLSLAVVATMMPVMTMTSFAGSVLEFKTSANSNMGTVTVQEGKTYVEGEIFTATIKNSTNGSASRLTISDGETAYIEAKAKPGYEFDKWTINSQRDNEEKTLKSGDKIDSEDYEWAPAVFTAYFKVKQASVELLKAKTVGTKAVKLSWTKVKGATKYVVYGTKCAQKFHKLATVNGKTDYTVKKIAGKKLAANNAYKYYVVAYNGSKKITRSKIIHFITGTTMGQYANAKKVTAVKTLSIDVGKKKSVKAKCVMPSGKKHLDKVHGNAMRYISTNPDIAAVDANGKVTAKSMGTVTIYSQDIGGKYAVTKVTVTKVFNVKFVKLDDETGTMKVLKSVKVTSFQKVKKPADSIVDEKYFNGNWKCIKLGEDGNIDGNKSTRLRFDFNQPVTEDLVLQAQILA